MAEASAQGGASGRAPGRPILFELARLAAVVALPLLGVIAFLLFARWGDVTELERVRFVMRRGVVHKLDGAR